MTRLAAILALFATAAHAQDYPSTVTMLRDTVSIEAHGTAQALVTYSNSADMASQNGLKTISVAVGDVTITVDVRIRVNDGPNGNEELAEVMPRDGYIAIPDRLHVADGQEGVFRVMLPMF